MSNINDHRIDIAGQDWSGAFRADGDYIAWRHVEPIIEANREMLEALQAIVATNPHNAPMTHEQIRGAYAQSLQNARAAIAKAKGAKP